jgi:hypothetical protein
MVEQPPEASEIREEGREPASAFYMSLANEYGSDIDLEALIRESREIDPGPELRSSSTILIFEAQWISALSADLNHPAMSGHRPVSSQIVGRSE